MEYTDTRSAPKVSQTQQGKADQCVIARNVKEKGADLFIGK